MGIAFRTDTEIVTVGEQEQKSVELFIGQYEFTCGVLEGTVVCETGPSENLLKGVIVKAVDQSDATKHYLGITNESGYFAICVPPGTYRLVVLCCPTGCCKGVACSCGCANV